MFGNANDGILVSVICTAYNHEKYIRQCLNGLIKQNTSFKYEIIIHDDASTDNTAKIIHEYESKYPNLIRAIYQTENQHSKHNPIMRLILPMIRGKYVALCEGDDYWSDEKKIQKQTEALELNPTCYVCLHTVRKIREDGVLTKGFFPQKKMSSCVLKQREFLNYLLHGYYFQTSSYFFDGLSFKEYIKNPPVFRKFSPVGDIPYLLYFSSLGNVIILNRVMSCYRMMSKGSWTERMINNGSGAYISHKEKMRLMYEQFNVFSNHKFNEIIQDKITNYECDIYQLNRQYQKCLSKRHLLWLLRYQPRAGILVLWRALWQLLINRQTNGDR